MSDHKNNNPDQTDTSLHEAEQTALSVSTEDGVEASVISENSAASHPEQFSQAEYAAKSVWSGQPVAGNDSADTAAGEEGLYTYYKEQASPEDDNFTAAPASTSGGEALSSPAGRTGLAQSEQEQPKMQGAEQEPAEAGATFFTTESGMREELPDEAFIDETPVDGTLDNQGADAVERADIEDTGKDKSKKTAPQYFPPLKVAPQARASLLSRLFDACAFIGPLALTALLLAQVAPALQEVRFLWLGETVQAEALRNVLAGEWMVPLVNGEVYFAAPPLYLWFMAAVHKLLALPAFDFWIAPGTDRIALSMLMGSAISGLLLLWAVLALARFVARFDRRGVFASGCVLLGFFLFAGALHYAGNQLFFTALVIIAQVFMYRALRYHGGNMLLTGAAFVFASLAFLAGGPLGLLQPVLVAVVFAFWEGRPWRLLRKDFLLGFVFSLLPAVLWAGSIWADGHYDVVVTLIREQVLGTLLHSLNYPESWWYYLLVLPLLLFPWVLLVIFPHWAGIFSKETSTVIKGAFRGEYQGLAYIWLVFCAALVGFLLLSAKSPLELLPVLAPVSVIAGRQVLKLSPVRNMLLQRCYAVLLLLLAFACAVVPVFMSGKAPAVLSWIGALGVPQLGIDIGGVFIVAAIFLAAGCLFLGAVSSRRPEGTLLVMLLMVAGLSLPVSLLSAPSLSAVFSPKTVASDMAAYADRGFKPYVDGIDPDVLVYYAGTGVEPAPEAQVLVERGQSGEKAVLLLPVSRFEGAAELYTAPATPGTAEAGNAHDTTDASSILPAISGKAEQLAQPADTPPGPVEAAAADIAASATGAEPDAVQDAVGAPLAFYGNWREVGRYRLAATEFVLLASAELQPPGEPVFEVRDSAEPTGQAGEHIIAPLSSPAAEGEDADAGAADITGDAADKAQ